MASWGGARPRGPLKQIPLELKGRSGAPKCRRQTPLPVGLHLEDAVRRAPALRHPPRESPEGLDREGGGGVRTAVGGRKEQAESLIPGAAAEIDGPGRLNTNRMGFSNILYSSFFWLRISLSSIYLIK